MEEPEVAACAVCGEQDPLTHVEHHVYSRKRSSETIILCNSCHQRVHMIRRTPTFKKELSERLNPEVYKRVNELAEKLDDSSSGDSHPTKQNESGSIKTPVDDSWTMLKELAQMQKLAKSPRFSSFDIESALERLEQIMFRETVDRLGKAAVRLPLHQQANVLTRLRETLEPISERRRSEEKGSDIDALDLTFVGIGEPKKTGKLLVQILEELGGGSNPVPLERFLQEATSRGIEQKKAEKTLERLMARGEVYEPRPDHVMFPRREIETEPL